MLEKEKSNERKFKNQNILANIDDKKVISKIINVVKWCFGILFILFALVNGFHYSSLFLITSGLLLLPIKGITKILTQINIKPKTSIILSVVLFVIGMITSPVSENNPNQTNEHKHIEEVIPGVAATCTKTGLTEGKKCSECREILLEQQEIPATGHTEVKLEGKVATCTKTGLTEGKKCIECGEILLEQQEIPTKDHSYIEGECSCGIKDPNYKPVVGDENNKDEEKQKYIVTFTAEIVNNNSVGNEWITGIKYESVTIRTGSSIEVKSGNNFSFVVFAIEEDDTGDDYGSSVIEFAQIKVGKTTSQTIIVKVIEDKGKYKGNIAEWVFIVTIERIK